jgi:transcriptional regulator with XRE-family HTH domain
MSAPQATEENSKKIKTIFQEKYRLMVSELVKCRRHLSLTQKEVAREVGWPNHTYLSKIETLEKRVDVIELALLAKTYKKSIGYFTKFLR